MAKKSETPRDINQLAAFIAEKATSDSMLDQSEEPQKNPAAIELGRLGGKEGRKGRGLQAHTRAEERDCSKSCKG